MKTSTPSKSNSNQRSPRLLSKLQDSQDISPATNDAIVKANQKFYYEDSEPELDLETGTTSKRLNFDGNADDESEDNRQSRRGRR